MIGSLVKKEIRGRYKGSLLGFMWNFILPLIQILVYIMVFSVIFRQNIENYYVYLIVGMVPWFMICDSFVSGAGSIVDNSQLVTKIYFPREVIPVSVVLSKFVNFLISMVITLIVVGVGGHGFDGIALLGLPLAIFLLLIFCIGAALILSAANVYMRDVQYMVNVLMMVFIWLTPIMYVAKNIDNEIFRMLLSLNPLSYIIELFQDALYWKVLPDTVTLLIAVVESVALLVIGIVVFGRQSRDFAEVL